MTNFALMDATGTYPTQLGAQETVPENAVVLPDGEDVSAYAIRYRDPATGAWAERPAIGAATVTATEAGWIVSYPSVPSAAYCEVTDRGLGETLASVMMAGGTISFLLADAGSYQLVVAAPAPWLGRTDNLVLA